MLSWDALARSLADRVAENQAERAAREQALRYEAWARWVVGASLDDFASDLTNNLERLGADVRRCLTVELTNPKTAGERVQRALSLSLSLDQVHIHTQWQPGAAPTVHLLWSRRRQQRFCQMVPIAGGRLMPLFHPSDPAVNRPTGELHGYRIVANDDSSHEVTREHLLLRALGLLGNGTRH